MAAQSIDPRLASARWYHIFEILPGLVTPGRVLFDAAALLDFMGISKDLSGKRAIDIGTWDGPMAFELERRGASVIALDILDPQETGFNVAKELLGSRVEHVQGSVYELGRLFSQPFDLVCFLGVYYHLTDPVSAFREISGVLSGDGQLFVEGECLRHYAEKLDGSAVSDDFVRQIADSDIPLALCCPGEYKQSPNWFVPNFACVSGWLRVANLKLLSHCFEQSDDGHLPHQRIKALAVKRGPSVVIRRVHQVGRSLIITGNGFSERTVINLFARQGDDEVNFGGLTPHGAVKLPAVVEGPDRLRVDIPPPIDSGQVTIEAINPPYAGNERAAFTIEIGR